MPREGVDPEGIVAVAATVADAEGLEAVSLARLAESLGVRSPSLYATSMASTMCCDASLCAASRSLRRR
jgi:Bacterial regulatory proteins, tetR family